MKKQVNFILADGSQMMIRLVANASTTIRYRQVFGKDLLVKIGSMIQSIGTDRLISLSKYQGAQMDMENLEEMPPELLDALIGIIGSGELNLVSELAYIMARQAEAQERAEVVNGLNLDDYVVWLDQFDSMTFLTGAMDVINTYMSNRQGASAAKKEVAQLTEK